MKKLLLLLLLPVMSNGAFAQLVITPATAAQMVQTLAGPGVVVSNITFSGTLSLGAAALFSNGNTTNIGINNGVLLTTGLATNAIGPNTSPSLGTNQAGAGDPALDALITPILTHDACILEFDIIPICDTLRFNYVFASEEYLEWVGLNIEDVFAFFISGPGIIGQQNIALAPVSLQPVQIGTINNVTNSAYYVDNPSGSPTIQYDGFTTVLTAEIIIQQCQTYHIKLAIADGSDFIYDSGVFLKQGTLSCFGVNIQASTSGNNGIDAIEACQNGLFQICLSNPQPTPFTFHYTIGGTATYGVDYNAIPDSVVFPPGVQCVSFTVIPTIDGLPEGTETIKLYYTPSNCANIDSAFINVLDLYTINAGPDMGFCTGDSVQIGTPTIPNTRYHWSPTLGLSNDTISNPWVQFVNTDTVPHYYLYYRTDSIQTCSNWDSVTVTVYPQIVPLAGNDITLCGGANGLIGSYTKAGYAYSWSPATGLTGANTAQPTVNDTNTTSAPVVYTYIVTGSQGGCTGKDTVLVTILPAPIADAGPPHSLCPDETIPMGSPSVAGYTYSWLPTSGLSATNISNPNITLTPPGTYTYTLTAGGTGCSDTATVAITVKPLPVSNAGSDISICSGSSGSLGAPFTTGYSYSWNPPSGLNNSTASDPSVSLLNTASTDIVSDFIVTSTLAGCKSADTVQVLTHATPVSAIHADPDTICLNKVATVTYGGATLNTPDYTWQWSGANVESGSGPGPYTISWGDLGSKTISLVVSDYGCASTPASVTLITRDCTIEPSNILTPDGDGQNDYFHIVNMDVNPHSRLLIFNRWGKKIYETDFYKNDWDGGPHIHAGVYFYVLTLTDGTEQRGTVTVMK